MAAAPKAAPAPETPSPTSDSSPPPSADASPPPPPPSSPSPPPPKASRPPASPPPPKAQPPPSPDETPPAPSPPKAQPPPSPDVTTPPPPTLLPPPSAGLVPPATTSPPPPAAIPTREIPTIPNQPNLLPTRGDASDKGAPGPARKLPSPSSRKSASKSSTDYSATNIPIIIGGIVVGIVVFLALFVICAMCNKKKKKGYYIPEQSAGVGGGGPYYHGKPDHVVRVGTGGGWGHPPQPPPMNSSKEFPGPRMSMAASTNMPLAFSQSQFSYDELVAATGGFTQYNLVGQGGFGFVHKGVLPNGQEVAIKSLKPGSGQGEREFQAEVEMLSRVHHRYLVSLVGYCISDGQRMLVYEFVPNRTLEFHLHGKGQVVMDWQTRMRIALGSAKGLAYLHEDCHPRIIHRDIKSANILLDHEYEAKVSDFGLAKLTTGNDTHVSTRVMGTFGYLAPEYASSGKLSEKSDVFSFGVMLLEILTGRKPIDPETEYMNDSLVEWARPLIAKAKEDGDYNELVDPRLKTNYDRNEMAQMASCAEASVRHSARRRPKMSQIVRALEGNASLDSLDEKETKGESALDTSESRVYDTQAYNDDMIKFRKMVMSTEESSGSEMGSSGQYR
ncbi:putative protein kinase RLK-Pelle-PERK-1 family [Helianthus anomalus]